MVPRQTAAVVVGAEVDVTTGTVVRRGAWIWPSLICEMGVACRGAIGCRHEDDAGVCRAGPSSRRESRFEQAGNLT